MLTTGNNSWLDGVRRFFGLKPRKTERVLRNLQSREHDVQSLEQRVVLSAVTPVTPQEAPPQNDLRSRILAAARRTKRSEVFRSNETTNPATGPTQNVSPQRRVLSRASFSSRMQTTSKSIRSTPRTHTPIRARSLQNSRLISGRATSRTPVLSRTPASKTGTLQSQSTNSRQSLSRSRLTRATSNSSSRLQNRSLQNSSMFRATQRKTSTTQYTTVQKRQDSPVKRYTESLRDRQVSSGFKRGLSISERIQTARNTSFTDRISRPTYSSTRVSVGDYDAFWASFNRNYSSNPWHAPVYR